MKKTYKAYITCIGNSISRQNRRILHCKERFLVLKLLKLVVVPLLVSESLDDFERYLGSPMPKRYDKKPILQFQKPISIRKKNRKFPIR